MYYNEKDTRVYMQSRDGKFKEFKSYLDMIKYLRNYDIYDSFVRKINNKFLDHSGNNWSDIRAFNRVGYIWNNYVNCEYVFFDAYMRVLNFTEVARDVHNIPAEYNKYWHTYYIKSTHKNKRIRLKYKDDLNSKWKFIPNVYKFRYDPVPGIRVWKRVGRYYRRIKTTQERRWNIAHLKLAKFRKRDLPNSWDDIPVSCREDRCWKRSKKRKQWM